MKINFLRYLSVELEKLRAECNVVPKSESNHKLLTYKKKTFTNKIGFNIFVKRRDYDLIRHTCCKEKPNFSKSLSNCISPINVILPHGGGFVV